ncbi:MAG: hypothetical protein AAB482_04530 [Patescibacteria group bacterium]
MLVSEPIFISSADKLYEAVVKSIALYGYAPEHNIHDYTYAIDDDTDNIFVSFADNMGILAKKEKHDPIWWMLAEPLAPASLRAGILVSFLKNIFQKQGAQRANLELMEDTYTSLLKILPDDLQARGPSEVLTAPIFELTMFDPEMRGNTYKGIRSVVRQFYKAHKVDVVDAKSIQKKVIFDLVARWRNHRTAQDEALDDYYVRSINEDFLGFDSARAIVVDDVVVGLNGGWNMPQNGRYYKALSLHDYSNRALGDVMMIEELTWLKRMKYQTADFGAGSKKITDFKNRFNPSFSYTSYEFIIEPAII